MKKKAFAAFALLLSLGMLCACSSGTTSVGFNANWFAFGEDNTGGKRETLEYEVTFESKPSSGFSAHYENGTYVTVMEGDGQGYTFRTELHISGAFTVNGQTGETFTDTITTEVSFKTTANHLQPISGTRTVKCTVPNENAKTVEDAGTVHEYSYAVDYNDPLTAADVTFEQTLPAKDGWEKNVSLGSTANFFDNDQLLFVMRGLTMTSTVTLRTLQLQSVSARNLTVKPAATIENNFTFEMNGTEVTDSINAYSVTVGYANEPAGTPQTVVYAAKKTDVEGHIGANYYHNVLLRMSTPYNYGTMNYKLIKATFAD